jgi:hypothetical protein
LDSNIDLSVFIFDNFGTAFVLCSSTHTTQSIKMAIAENGGTNQIFKKKFSLCLLPPFLPMVRKDMVLELIV